MTSTPTFLTSVPASVLLWIGSIAVVTVIGRQFGRSRDAKAAGTRSEFVRTMLASSAKFALYAVSVVVVFGGIGIASELDNVIGTIAHWTLLALIFGIAMVAGLFIARQFLAPPWWRLNAWEPSYDRSSFGTRDAMAWILDDIRELRASMRLIDQLVCFVCVPLLIINVMVLAGIERTLMVGLVGLLVCYVALVVALFTANRIPRALLTRLQDLRVVARRIANGDLTARVDHADIAEYEELGELVGDVNNMARTLQSREQEKQALTYQLHQTLQFEQERASRDQLTGLRNHRYFQEALAAELYRCSRTGESATIAVIDLDDFKAVNDTFGHQEGDAVLQRTAAALTQTLRPYDLPARLGGEEFGIIFPATTPQEAKMVMDRIMDVLATAGPNESSQTFSGGIATFPAHAKDQSTLYQLADSSAYVAKLNGKKHTVIFDPSKVANVSEDDRVNTRERDLQVKAARTLVQTVDALEGFGNEHSENVGQISSRIANALGYDDSFAQQMYLCGLLHDVGKLGLEQSLMQKAGQLTPEEYEQVKRHPDLSAQIVVNAGLGEIADWVRHHHEHFDGTGYPLGLAGQDIPIGSRIVLVAEAFDVMTTDRAYRHAMSSRDALDELMRNAGARFDPDIVMTLVHLVQNGVVRAAGGAAPGPSIWQGPQAA
jgi:diguanylate cyclase (GGDEF)-like protein